MICPICKKEGTSLDSFSGSDAMHANLLEKNEILFNWCTSLGYEIESDVPGEWRKTVSMFFDSHQNLEAYDVLNLINMYSFGGWFDQEDVRVLLDRHYYSKVEGMLTKKIDNDGIELHLNILERKLLYDALHHYSAYGENEKKIIDEIPKICELLNALDLDPKKKEN